MEDYLGPEDRIEWSLDDDGTMDTVLSLTCRCCGETIEERYDCEFASDYRDPLTGELDEKAFDEVVQSDDHWCDNCENYG